MYFHSTAGPPGEYLLEAVIAVGVDRELAPREEFPRGRDQILQLGMGQGLALAAEVKKPDLVALFGQAPQHPAIDRHGQEDRSFAFLDLLQAGAARAAQRAGQGRLDVDLGQALLRQQV
jgi:hypothetical protein